MAPLLTADEFYESAREFAHVALAAHHEGKNRQVAVNAATSLEHLAKACLASRSPALLVDLKRGDFSSLVRLLDMQGVRPGNQLRTASLREALSRVELWVKSAANGHDVKMLVDLRDGMVHAALNDEVEDQLLAAFVTHGDALLADLKRDREAFWSDQLAVVEALVANATDKVARRVAVKLAAAKANFDTKYKGMPTEVLEMLRKVATGVADDDEQGLACPVCETSGIAYGEFDVETSDAWWEDGEPNVDAWVQFTATAFTCRMCGLHLDSPAEIAAANVATTWEVPGADPSDFLSTYDEDAAYEAWREEQF